MYCVMYVRNCVLYNTYIYIYMQNGGPWECVFTVFDVFKLPLIPWTT